MHTVQSAFLHYRMVWLGSDLKDHLIPTPLQVFPTAHPHHNFDCFQSIFTLTTVLRHLAKIIPRDRNSSEWERENHLVTNILKLFLFGSGSNESLNSSNNFPSPINASYYYGS